MNIDTIIGIRKLIQARGAISEKLLPKICEINGVRMVGAEVAAYDQTMDSASQKIGKELIATQGFLSKVRKKDLDVINMHLWQIQLANDKFKKIVEVCDRRIALDRVKYENMEIGLKRYDIYDVFWMSNIIKNIDLGVDTISNSLDDISKVLDILDSGRNDTREVIEFLASKNIKDRNGSITSDRGKMSNIIGLENIKSDLKSLHKGKIRLFNPKLNDFEKYLHDLVSFIDEDFDKLILGSNRLAKKLDSTINRINKYRKSDFKHSRGTTNKSIDNRYDIVDTYTSIEIQLMTDIRAYIDSMVTMSTAMSLVFNSCKDIFKTKPFTEARG